MIECHAFIVLLAAWSGKNRKSQPHVTPLRSPERTGSLIHDFTRPSQRLHREVERRPRAIQNNRGGSRYRRREPALIYHRHEDSPVFIDLVLAHGHPRLASDALGLSLLTLVNGAEIRDGLLFVLGGAWQNVQALNIGDPLRPHVAAVFEAGGLEAGDYTAAVSVEDPLLNGRGRVIMRWQ